MTEYSYMAALFVLGLSDFAAAAPAPQSVPAGNLLEQPAPSMPPILSLRDRARLQDKWLAERLDQLVPALMREQKIDMWVLVAREYLEDPVVATMLNAKSMHARRRTILLFYDPGAGRPVERITVSSYGLANLFEAGWDPEKEPDQWKQLGKLIEKRQPKRIAVNSSALTQFGDGLTLSQYEGLRAAVPPKLRGRIVRTDKLAVGWLETRTSAEMKVYPQVVRIAHAIIAEGLSNAVIRPGETSAEDVTWWFREKISSLGLRTWFHPSVGILRQGKGAMLGGDEVIQKGDLLDRLRDLLPWFEH